MSNGVSPVFSLDLILLQVGIIHLCRTMLIIQGGLGILQFYWDWESCQISCVFPLFWYNFPIVKGLPSTLGSLQFEETRQVTTYLFTGFPFSFGLYLPVQLSKNGSRGTSKGLSGPKSNGKLPLYEWNIRRYKGIKEPCKPSFLIATFFNTNPISLL